MWIKEFQNALVLKDTQMLNKLMENVPQLSDPKDIDAALCLLKEATTFVQSLKDETEASMQQMQKNINYLKSTQESKASQFDVSF